MEFAIVAPFFVVVLLGTAQVGRMLEVQNELTSAVREGARLASMDRRTLSGSGQTLNQMMEQEVRTYLTLHGLPGDTASVFITEVGDLNTTFDVNNPDNNLRYFQLRVELPYSSVGRIHLPGLEGIVLAGEVVFRNSRAITQ